MREYYQSIFEGRLSQETLDSMSSEAYVDLLRIAAALGEANLKVTAATLDETSETEDGAGGHRFPLLVDCEEKQFVASLLVKEVKGAWKLCAVKIPGIRD
jgi:hypothetical protein